MKRSLKGNTLQYCSPLLRWDHIIGYWAARHLHETYSDTTTDRRISPEAVTFQNPLVSVPKTLKQLTRWSVFKIYRFLDLLFPGQKRPMAYFRKGWKQQIKCKLIKSSTRYINHWNTGAVVNVTNWKSLNALTVLNASRGDQVCYPMDI